MSSAPPSERGRGRARRGRLFWKYVIVLVALVSVALLASSLVEVYFSFQESKDALINLHREKARGAASRIESFVREIERQIGWTTQPQLVAPSAALEQRRIDYLRLLRQVPPITELSFLDPAGREQLRVSRVAMDVVGSGLDVSREPRFVEARAGKTYYSPVYFRKESEPYMTIAMPSAGGTGVTAAEVNLKFIWDVVSQIKVGRAGRAFVVDRQGVLIADPDISLVLQKTSLADLEHVRAALAAPVAPGQPVPEVPITRDLRGRRVLSAHSAIPSLRWTVFIEQPLEEAFEPLRASITRAIVLLVLGVGLSVAVSLLLARRMVQPIRALQQGAERIGAGELGARIAVETGDELESLADQFNRMTTQLQESYATLEQKVDERTRELSEALEQQTATSQILRVISESPTDVEPVFRAILDHVLTLGRADFGGVFRFEDGSFRPVAAVGGAPGFIDDLRRRGGVPAGTPTPLGMVGVERAPLHTADVENDPRFAPPDYIRQEGMRSVLAVPMLKEGAVVGALTVHRHEVRPFSDKQITLLQTFADQAVIAIENARLFTELQERTRELARSVEELRALGEMGQVISSSLDLHTVLTRIVGRARELARADGCVVWEFDEATGRFYARATEGMPPELLEVLRSTPPVLGEGAVGRAAARRELVQIADIETAYEGRLRDALLHAGHRALLAVPLLREDRIIGALTVNRSTAREFEPRVVELLKAFASQSSLAIQNARLFEELADKTRQLEIANRHKSEFLANMSHELRTPLNAVIGFSEVLLERMFGEINEKQEEYLQDILASGRHLLSLINDILDLSKIEAGRMELEITEFDLPQAIENALILVRERAARRGLAVTTAVDPALGAFRGDERKLKQVLLNLLSNAVKFTPEGGRIEVRAARVDGHVEVAVADTGVGIAPEDQAAIFEEFRQVGSDYAKKREGTGLGLTLARRFVELHGGTLAVRSEVGLGSTFTLTLPERPWPASSC